MRVLGALELDPGGDDEARIGVGGERLGEETSAEAMLRLPHVLARDPLPRAGRVEADTLPAVVVEGRERADARVAAFLDGRRRVDARHVEREAVRGELVDTVGARVARLPVRIDGDGSRPGV